MAAPVLNSVGQRLYSALGPLAWRDAELGYPLAYFCGCIGIMLSPLDDLVRETDTHPGWAKALDVDVAPVFVLPWLAQFVGVELDPRGQETEEIWAAKQRERIKVHVAYQRGSVPGLLAQAKLWLTGTKTAFLRERDTNAWHMTLVTLISETPDQTGMLADLRAHAKAGGLKLDNSMVVGWDLFGIDTAYSSFTAIDTDFATFDRLQEGPP